MAKKKTETEIVQIRPIEWAYAKVRLVGDTPLLVHAWDAKARREILEKQIGAAKAKNRDEKNPEADFASAMYWLTPQPEELTSKAVQEAIKTARFGFKVTAIKQAAISAAYRKKWVKDKMGLRTAFFIESDADGYYAGELVADYDRKRVDIIPNKYRPEQLVEIHSDPPVMRDDMVKVGIGSADIRYRGQFNNWYIDIVVKYDKNGTWSIDDIVNILDAGGAFCGIGEWRPEKDGVFGQFHVEIADN